LEEIAVEHHQIISFRFHIKTLGLHVVDLPKGILRKSMFENDFPELPVLNEKRETFKYFSTVLEICGADLV